MRAKSEKKTPESEKGWRSFGVLVLVLFLGLAIGNAVSTALTSNKNPKNQNTRSMLQMNDHYPSYMSQYSPYYGYNDDVLGYSYPDIYEPQSRYDDDRSLYDSGYSYRKPQYVNQHGDYYQNGNLQQEDMNSRFSQANPNMVFLLGDENPSTTTRDSAGNLGSSVTAIPPAPHPTRHPTSNLPCWSDSTQITINGIFTNRTADIFSAVMAAEGGKDVIPHYNCFPYQKCEHSRDLIIFLNNHHCSNVDENRCCWHGKKLKQEYIDQPEPILAIALQMFLNSCGAGDALLVDGDIGKISTTKLQGYLHCRWCRVQSDDTNCRQVT